MLLHQSAAASVVGAFLGLPAFDWPSAGVHGLSSSPGGPSEHDAIPFDDDVIARFKAFFKRRGTKYWDLVNAAGYIGCKALV